MKRNLIILIYLTAVFIAVSLITGSVMNTGNTDTSAEMSEASFPVVSFRYGSMNLNRLYGYAGSMDCSFTRGSLLPLDESRMVSLRIDPYGEKITEASYEVRNIDGSRLIESTPINDLSPSEEKLAAELQLKDLIDSSSEYMLIILLSTEKASDIRYYTRIAVNSTDCTGEKIDFVRSIHNMTFDKDSGESLTRYLESNSEGNNTDLASVDIHSSYDQVTWGSLYPHIEGEENLNIMRSDGDTGIFSMDYLISTEESRRKTWYLVNEYYRVRYTEDRSYLLAFQRTMEQIYDQKASFMTDNVTSLGITGPKVEYMESDSGGDIAFVSAGSLYIISAFDNSLSEVFNFRNGDMFDARCMCSEHDIEILSVDESGGARFAVYGYMNRGIHEGQCGIALYEYNSSTNSVSEKAFILSNRPFEAIAADIGILSYLNSRGIFYFYMDGAVHAVDIETLTDSMAVKGLGDNNYGVSGSGLMLVWQNGSIYDSTKLNTMNFGSGKSDSIDAPPGDCILPLGFMGENLVYGLAHRKDIISSYEGQLFPMYRIMILDSNEKVLMVYEKDGYYVTSAEIGPDRIDLTRVTAIPAPEGDDGAEKGYEEAAPDQIMATSVEASSTALTFVAVDVYETIAELRLPSGIKAASIKKTSPKQVLFEGDKYVELSEEDSLPRFRVYGIKGLDSMYAGEAAAVERAVSISGAVTANDGTYIWEKKLLSIRNQIMKIKPIEETDSAGSLNAVLDVMLSCAGTPVNSSAMTSKGVTPYNVLTRNLPDKHVLNLTGCALDTMLYYLDRDYPVLSLSDEGAVLITGFNESEVVLLDPAYLVLSPGNGTLSKVSRSAASAAFADSGNVFITYTDGP